MNELGHSYDTALPMQDIDLAILGRVDEVVKEAIASQNAMMIFGFGVALRKAAQSSGLGLAKLLCDGRDNWNSFRSDDDFATVAKYEMGISDDTYNKYTRVWDHVVNSSYLLEHSDMRDAIMGKPIRGLILLTAAARENELEEEHWEIIAKAPNVDAIRDVVSNVRGWKTSSHGRLTLMLQSDGQLRAKIGETGYEVVGHIKRDGSKLSDAVISRLEKAGVMVEAK